MATSKFVNAGELVDGLQQLGNGLKETQTNVDAGVLALSQVGLSIVSRFTGSGFTASILNPIAALALNYTALEIESKKLALAISANDNQKIKEGIAGVIGAFGGLMSAIPIPHIKGMGIAISLAAATYKEIQTGDIRSLYADLIKYLDKNNWQSIFDEITAKKQNSNTWSGGGGQYIAEGASSLVVSTGTQGATTLANFEVETAKQPDGYLGICLKDDEDKKPRRPGGGGGPGGGVSGGVTGGTGAVRPGDPLVLDLDGDGVELITNANTILFDHNQDGIRTGTQWVKADDGMLVRDLNGNGAIDSGRELFGDQTQISATSQNPSGLARNGFEALRPLDSNGDNRINALDSAFSELQVWRDLNQDGISQEGELQSLGDAGISEIRLGQIETTGTGAVGDPLINTDRRGETTGQNSFVRNGSEQTLRNINFRQDTFVREFTDSPTVTAEAAALPQMRGSGLVRDMQEAMSLRDASGNQTVRVATAATTNSIALCAGNTRAGGLKRLKNNRKPDCTESRRNRQIVDAEFAKFAIVVIATGGYL